MSDQIWLAVAAERPVPHGGISDASYSIESMEWEIQCRDGTRLKFHGDLERANGAGWPLHHPRSRLERTMSLRPLEFRSA